MEFCRLNFCCVLSNEMFISFKWLKINYHFSYMDIGYIVYNDI